MSDLYIDSKSRVYIDGHQIDRVVSLQVEVDRGRTLVQMEFQPDSIIRGELPPSVIEEVMDAHTPTGSGQVDMQKAMENARKRAQGINPVGAKVQPVTRPVKDSPQA